MGLLKKEPAGKVTSAEELMAVADAMEREAGHRYRELTRYMQLRGEERLAELFAFLGQTEDKHADQVEERARDIIGKSPDLAVIRWELPKDFEDEAARSYLLTPYRALAIAVRNEERGFAFYSYLAAGAETDRLRELAESFAKDKLDHAALLRRERRKAWREEIASSSVPVGWEWPESLGALWTQAAAIEGAAADGHRAIAEALRAAGDAQAAALFEEAAADESACAANVGANLEALSIPALTMPSKTVVDGLRILEYAFERYSDIVEHASDEAVMREAQALSEHALRRLARVQGSVEKELLEETHG